MCTTYMYKNVCIDVVVNVVIEELNQYWVLLNDIKTSSIFVDMRYI